METYTPKVGDILTNGRVKLEILGIDEFGYVRVTRTCRDGDFETMSYTGLYTVDEIVASVDTSKPTITNRYKGGAQ